MKKAGREKSLAKAVQRRPLPRGMILYLLLIMGTYRMLLTENNVVSDLEREDKLNNLLFDQENKKNEENTYPGGSSMKPFCQQWSASDAFNRTLQPFDEWYTHHPDWIITNEADAEFCIEPGDTQTQPISNMMKFYVNQFHSPCNLLHALIMWNSGWSADMWNIQVGLIHALNHHVPLLMEVHDWHPWHYTANKDDHTNLTCDSGDTTCYFLPYHGCGSVWNTTKIGAKLTLGPDMKLLEGVDDRSWGSSIFDDFGWSAYLFMTRKQLWLRRAVFDYKEQFRQSNAIDAGSSDCTVIHVRRGDVAHSNERIYFPVYDYVKMIPQERLNDPNHYIFLMTDDSGAIEEAHEFYPELRWTYINKPRFNGSNVGWEDQMPSRNPAYEVIMLLSEFELAMACSTFVHGHSGFSNFILQYVSSLLCIVFMEYYTEVSSLGFLYYLMQLSLLSFSCFGQDEIHKKEHHRF